MITKFTITISIENQQPQNAYDILSDALGSIPDSGWESVSYSTSENTEERDTYASVELGLG